MRCNNIMNQGILEFNMELISLILSLAAFVVSLFGDDIGIAKPGQAFLLFLAVVFSIIWGIGLHQRKCKAMDILFVLERMNRNSDKSI